MMKAMLTDVNKNFVWSDVPDPIMKEDEAIVEIHSAALNRADLLQRQGKYPSPEGCPEWMGLEISGMIKELGPKASQKTNADKKRKQFFGYRFHFYI
jgi:NADPH2:quinone reductase